MSLLGGERGLHSDDRPRRTRSRTGDASASILKMVCMAHGPDCLTSWMFLHAIVALEGVSWTCGLRAVSLGRAYRTASVAEIYESQWTLAGASRSHRSVVYTASNGCEIL